jgi:hypothetical protein
MTMATAVMKMMERQTAKTTTMSHISKLTDDAASGRGCVACELVCRINTKQNQISICIYSLISDHI